MEVCAGCANTWTDSLNFNGCHYCGCVTIEIVANVKSLEEGK
jgi:hypothetical protein